MIPELTEEELRRRRLYEALMPTAVDPGSSVSPMTLNERQRQMEALKLLAPADAAKRTPGAEGRPDPVMRGLQFAAEMAPGTGEAMSLVDFLEARKKGDKLGMGLSALGMIPVVGAVGRGGKGLKKLAGEGLEALRKTLGPGESTTRAIRGGGAIPSFREMSPEDALAAARRGEHLRRVGESNQYVGAPRGIESPVQLRELRQAYDDLVELGVDGGDWYDRAMRSTVEAAGYNPKRQRLFAQEAGLWSAQANPDVNLGFMLQGHNAYELGSPLSKVRTQAQAARYNAARDVGSDIPLGPKTGEYTNKFDPTSPNSHISTNDIWHFRNWGYTQDGKPWSAGGTPQMHSFVDAESILAADRANARQLGGRTDWDAASTQAAPWVYAKGKSLHQKYPKRFPTLQDGIDEANKTYNDFFPKYTANATYEAIPGAGTGHLEGIVGASPELRAAYSADPRSSWSFLTDQERSWRELLPESLRGAGDNRDVLYDAAGLYVRPTNEATGYFRAGAGAPLETNPAFAAQPLVAFEASKGGPNVALRDQRALDAVEALRAYLDAQNAGAWHKTFNTGKVADRTSISIPMDRALTDAEMRSLADVVEPRGFAISDTGTGVNVLNFGDGPKSGRDLKRLLGKDGLGREIYQALPDARAAEPVRLNSGYVMQDENWKPLMRAENAGSGKATLALERYLTDPEIPDLLDTLDADPRLRQAALDRFERDAEYAERIGAATRDDIQRARKIVSERGLKGLFDAARQGVALPVLAIGVLGTAAGRRQGTTEEPIG